jgi:NAD(P)-dependent dehydrogenase (short-subunit alcohol dehydrogenase family)
MARILITGARRGIGLNASLRLAARGHEVIVGVHRAESISEVENAARAAGVSVIAEKLDILDPADRQRAVAHHVDVLINNAAIGDTGPLIEVPMERVRSTYETNVVATLALTQEVIRPMIERGSGKIIFIGSLLGRLSMPFMGPYAMTKFALEAASAALRAELKPFGVTVCIVEPGAYATGFNEAMHARKYEWLGDDSAYRKHMHLVKFYEQANLRPQVKHTDNIAHQIVKAVEARRPKPRYTAPWWQAWGAQLLRVFGR